VIAHCEGLENARSRHLAERIRPTMPSHLIVPPVKLPEKRHELKSPLNGGEPPSFTVFTSRVPLGTLYVVVAPVPFTVSDEKETRLSHFNGRVYRAQFVSERAVGVEVAR
jgi:hypothetical protein